MIDTQTDTKRVYLLGLPFQVHMHRIEELFQTLSQTHFSTFVACNKFRHERLERAESTLFFFSSFCHADNLHISLRPPTHLSLADIVVLSFGGFVAISAT